MGGGKQSARQKMINLMYLVYLALLALQVSADILKAFVRVNTGLEITVSNFENKNKALYDDFGVANTQNAAKTQVYFDAAQEVKKQSQILYNYYEHMKAKVFAKSSGQPLENYLEKNKAGVDTAMGLQFYKENLAEYENVTRAFGLAEPAIPKPQKDGYDAITLTNNMKAYREDMLKILSDNGAGKSQLAKAVQVTYDMPDIQESDLKVSWAAGNFSHKPLAAVITILSKLQGDVRNTESSVVSYLLSKIGSKDIKVNHIEAIVTSPSNYVFVGDTFRAKVLLAAYDTTQIPDVYYSLEYDSINKKLTGQVDKAITKNGRGLIDIHATKEGEHTYHGILSIKGPAGDTLSYPWKTSYTVAHSSVTVSPTKMNVFYIGVDNPVSISAPGVPSGDIKPSIAGGRISKSKDGWTVRVTRPGKASVSVSAEIDGKSKNLGKAEFRVKRIPNPVPYVGGTTGSSTIKLIQIQHTIMVNAKMENFDFDVAVQVVGFDFSTPIHGVLFEDKSRNRYFTKKMKDVINQAKRGQKMYFENIRVKMPDGTVRKVAPVTLRAL